MCRCYREFVNHKLSKPETIHVLLFETVEMRFMVELPQGPIYCHLSEEWATLDATTKRHVYREIFELNRRLQYNKYFHLSVVAAARAAAHNVN